MGVSRLSGVTVHPAHRKDGPGQSILADLPNIHATFGVRLPLRTSPLIFAVRNSDMTTENLWGVGVARGLSAFVYCGSRYAFDDDHWHDTLKGALRRVGHNEVSLARGQLMHLLPGQCLWLRWPAQFTTDWMVPCYTLYMPGVDWGVRFTDEERTRRARKFRALREPHILIDDGREHDTAIAISMLRLQVGRRVDRIDGRPASTIGVLPFTADFSIHVTVASDPAERLREVRERMSGQLDRLSRDHWFEETEDVVFTTMGNDEVGYATVVRQPQTVLVSASAAGAATDAPTP